MADIIGMLTTPFLIWAGLLVLIALVWGFWQFALNREIREVVRLRSDQFDGPPVPAPRVSVVVAAKDEEEYIEACVQSFCSQDYPDLEVIAVNDRSADRTPEILDRLASGKESRVQALHVSELREGWFGKNNAMREGVERATGEWLLFTDADCKQISKKSISVAVRFALENDIDFLTVMPILETRSFWERVIQPVCASILLVWFRPRQINDPKSPVAYAYGMFMLMKRELYDSLGGHERTKTEVNEDMHLARLTKEAGRRLVSAENEDLYRTRMYSGLAESWRGWSRIFYGSMGSFGRLLSVVVGVCLVSLFPWASLIAAASVWCFHDGDSSPWRIMTILSGLAVLVQQAFFLRFYRLIRADVRYVPTYVVGAVLAVGMLLSAMLKRGGRGTVTWRGTTYRGARVADPQD